MLNLGMLYFNRDGRLTVPDVIDPIIIAENPQSLGDRLVDAASTNFNRMFNFLKIENRKLCTSSEAPRRFIIFVFSSLE